MNWKSLTAVCALTIWSATAAAQPRLDQAQGSNGVLGGSDQTENGSYYDDFRVSIGAGQRVRVSANQARGSSLDPMVLVFAPGSTAPLASDDDSGGFPNARLEFTASRAGTYVVRVRGYMRSTGAYDLRVEPLGTMGSRLPLQNFNRGSFNNSVPTREGGSHFQDYTIRLNAGEDIVLRMESSAFDSYLYVYETGQESGSPLASNDDFGGTLNSGLLFRAPRTATYTIRASEPSHGDGTYTLRFTRLP